MRNPPYRRARCGTRIGMCYCFPSPPRFPFGSSRRNAPWLKAKVCLVFTSRKSLWMTGNEIVTLTRMFSRIALHRGPVSHEPTGFLRATDKRGSGSGPHHVHPQFAWEYRFPGVYPQLGKTPAQPVDGKSHAAWWCVAVYGSGLYRWGSRFVSPYLPCHC